MKTRMRLPAVRLSLISLSVYAGLVQAAELNTDLLRGVSDVPSVLKSGVDYPSGENYVDVLINGAKTSRMPLTISQADEMAGKLCLAPEWLQSAGVFFKSEPENVVKSYVRPACGEIVFHQTEGQRSLTDVVDISLFVSVFHYSTHQK